MYIPAHFAMTAGQVADVLKSGLAGDLVTHGPDGLVATYLPMVHDPDGTEFGRLIGHLSLVNDQWRPAAAGEPVEALFVLHGPDDYVEAEWLSTPSSPNVPTWNYVTVHVWGTLAVHREPDWMLDAVRRLSAAHGDASVEELAPADVEKLLRAIVGVELKITRIDGKAKMSQNKTPQVVGQVIDGLRGTGGDATADWMQEHSLPRAQAKADLLGSLRTSARLSGREVPKDGRDESGLACQPSPPTT